MAKRRLTRNRISKLFSIAALTGVVSATFLFALETPATAHNTCSSVYHDRSPTRLGYACLSSHVFVEVCDVSADNFGVRILYTLASGRTGLRGDSNGSSAPCHFDYVSTVDDPVVRYQVCAGPNGENRYCSGVVYH